MLFANEEQLFSKQEMSILPWGWPTHKASLMGIRKPDSTKLGRQLSKGEKFTQLKQWFGCLPCYGDIIYSSPSFLPKLEQDQKKHYAGCRRRKVIQINRRRKNIRNLFSSHINTNIYIMDADIFFQNYSKNKNLRIWGETPKNVESGPQRITNKESHNVWLKKQRCNCISSLTHTRESHLLLQQPFDLILTTRCISTLH